MPTYIQERNLITPIWQRCCQHIQLTETNYGPYDIHDAVRRSPNKSSTQGFNPTYISTSTLPISPQYTSPSIIPPNPLPYPPKIQKTSTPYPAPMAQGLLKKPPSTKPSSSSKRFVSLSPPPPTPPAPLPPLSLQNKSTDINI